ncbi:hypothetical protein RhiirB3_445916 [Rhizophagus irregularis]|nr:hypothetical protein RhiirB3_445916 [Rhizophagus irregularis]
MSKLNNDILCLIFEELRDDEKTLYSCLSINKEFCEIIIPILWKNPWKFLKKGKERLLLNVIISHLSKESKNNLNQNIIFINSYQILRNSSISELEELLIRCQYLDELYLFDYDGIDLNNLFRILTRSSPTNLFKFKFSFSQIDLDSLELFFENWKGRHPMILQFVRQTEDIEVLIEKYKSEGVIKNYNSDLVL